jgi:hypothetical protein
LFYFNQRINLPTSSIWQKASEGWILELLIT